jgi:hypothetical protein
MCAALVYVSGRPCKLMYILNEVLSESTLSFPAIDICNNVKNARVAYVYMLHWHISES